MDKKYTVFLIVTCLWGNPVDAQNKPYLTRVLEYCPAPGQFIHELPAYSEGDDAQSMANKCLESFNNQGLVSLGGYGGYITVGFDHPVKNVKGNYDLLIYGNANRFGTSAEPGIVLVMTDSNGNGLPDDTWYELAGSEYNNQETIHAYEITYTRPDKDDEDVPWKDNQGNNGFVKYMGMIGSNYNHAHAHYPKWLNSNTLTFKGSRLPDNGVWDDENRMWVMKPWPYGYADNLNSKEGCSFKLDWAVDETGEPANLEQIDFVRIYTAVNQQIGAGVGELSTEIADVQDLHPEATKIESVTSKTTYLIYHDKHLHVGTPFKKIINIYNIQGVKIRQIMHSEESGAYPIDLPSGIYYIHTDNQILKIAIP